MNDHSVGTYVKRVIRWMIGDYRSDKVAQQLAGDFRIVATMVVLLSLTGSFLKMMLLYTVISIIAGTGFVIGSGIIVRRRHSATRET